MTLVADESVSGPVIKRLRASGHGVLSVSETAPGTADDEVLRLANAAGAVLLTEDTDFGETVFRQRLIHSGVVLLRVQGLAAPAAAELVARTIAERADDLPGCFCVISPGHVRVRPGR